MNKLDRYSQRQKENNKNCQLENKSDLSFFATLVTNLLKAVNGFWRSGVNLPSAMEGCLKNVREVLF